MPDPMPLRLQRLALRQGSRAALQWRHLGRWQVMDWSSLHTLSQALAAGLRTLGLGPGRELALVGPPGPALVLALLALRRLGATLAMAAAPRQAGLVARASHVLAVSDHDLEQVQRDLGPAAQVVIAADPPAGELPATAGAAAARMLSLAQVLRLDAALPVAVRASSAPAVRLLLPDAELVLHEQAPGAQPPGERVFAELDAAWPAGLQWLVADWLHGGATLVLPEPGGDLVHDRREARAAAWLAPAAAVDGLLADLPQRVCDGALARHATRAALAGGRGPLARLARARLRAVIGLAATRQLLTDLAPQADAATALQGLGLALRSAGRPVAGAGAVPAPVQADALLAVGAMR